MPKSTTGAFSQAGTSRSRTPVGGLRSRGRLHPLDRRTGLNVRLALAALLALGSPVLIPTLASAGSQPNGGGLYPDLQTVVPRHLGVQNTAQREYLRFANGIANTGPGHLRMRPDPPFGVPTEFTTAIQQILDAQGNVVQELNAG